MYDLCGGCKVFPHRLSAFIAAIYVPEFAPFHWLTGEVTDRPPPAGVCLLMADVVIWYNLNLSHMFLHMQPHLEILLFYCAPHLYTCQALVERLAEAFHVLLFRFMHLGDVCHIRTSQHHRNNCKKWKPWVRCHRRTRLHDWQHTIIYSPCRPDPILLLATPCLK